MKTGTRRSGPAARRVPEDMCPTCGAIMRRTNAAVLWPVNGHGNRVAGVSHLRCPSCGEGMYSIAEIEALDAAAFAIYRKRFGLLIPDEVRAIREQHRLTQAELARLLRLGANTISRWEAGRTVQTAAMDILLRMVRDVPASLLYLRRGARRTARMAAR